MKKTLFLLCLLPFSAVAQKLWTLNDCIAYAKEHNLSIKQSEIDLKSTDIEVWQTKANFLPSINSEAAYNWNTGKNINPVSNQFENTTFESASGGVSMSMPLFSGLQNWRKLQQAKCKQLATQYQLDMKKDEIILMIINAYTEVLSNKEKIKIQKAQLEISKESVARTRELINAGSLPKGDIYESEAQLFSLEQKIIETESALFIGKMGLAQLLLLKNYKDFEVADNTFEVPIADILNKTPEEIYQSAKEIMGEVKLATANVQLAESSLRLSQSAFWPRLSAQWGYSSRWSKNQVMDFWKQLDTNKGMYAGLSLNIPIFNHFSVLSNVKTQKLALQKMQLAKEQTELSTEKNIYQAYNDAANAKKLYEASEKTAQAKEQSFSYAQERHNVGLMNTFDFNQSKYEYENAQNDVIKAKYQYIFKLKVLEYYFSH